MSAFRELPEFSRRLPAFEDHDRQEVRHTTCYMCACRCGVKVTLENGGIRFIQGTPGHPVNDGVICAKGSAGILKQASPAKLRTPLRRRPGSERGSGDFEAISWEEALDELTERLRRIRAEDPKKLAYFTGRDQMQALTGLFAMQFGTINFAAHGGFCSVNMAAAGAYSVGQTFWEFADPDFDRTKYFLLWGVAEDHSSNPIKLGIDKVKRRGGKFVYINPARTGYGAIADQWVPIRPGTDGMLALAMVHVLLARDLIDQDYLVRYTNAPHLVIDDPGASDHGLMAGTGDVPAEWREGRPLVWDLEREDFVDGYQAGIKPALVGEYTLPDGRRVRTVMRLVLEKYLDERFAPEHAAEVCGVPAETIENLALEMAHVAFHQSIEVPCEWTDWAGRSHDHYLGRPVSMHAMRGISAHSNGFDTCRAIHLLQTLLGTLDVPGGHRAKPSYPKRIPPSNKPAREMAPETPLDANPLGYPTGPEHLCIDDNGRPTRIDKAYSWEAPLAAHGLIQNVITNAVAGDPYPIDTLLVFMANLSWNSSMDSQGVMERLRERGDDGEYKLPYFVVVDAFDSEVVQFADLVLPDTTYLERYDVLSLLDRPPSEPEAIVDAIRAPVLEPDRDVRPWQDVMVELAGRLGFPAFVDDDGKPKYRDYRDFVVNYQKAPGIGFLAGWRGADGGEALKGEPNPGQWERYVDNRCYFRWELPLSAQFYKFANQEYLALAKDLKFLRETEEPVTLHLYSPVLQRFRLAGEGVYDGPRPTEPADAERLATYFDPLPDWHEPLEHARVDDGYSFRAITQRPMMQYHSWDAQNPWLREILSRNDLYMNRARGEEMGLADGDWVWVESHHGRVRARLRLIEGTQPDTVWTWNAIAKRPGTWGLDEDAPESRHGFLMNHLISERLPTPDGARVYANADPVTGQAAWYDLRVRVRKAGAHEAGAWPVPDPAGALPDEPAAPPLLRHHTHAPVNLRRAILDTLLRRNT